MKPSVAMRMIPAVMPACLSASRDIILSDHLVWIVVGDREKVEAGIREFDLGEMVVADADGNPI